MGNNMQNANMARWVQWLLGIILAINLSFTSWIAIKAIDIDKELTKLKATTAVKFVAYDKMEVQVEKTYRSVTRIEAKLDIGSP